MEHIITREFSVSGDWARISFSAGVALGLARCASDRIAGSQQSRAARHREFVAKNEEEGCHPPRIGMSKDDVLNLHHKPTNLSVTSRGEAWFSVFNNFDGRNLIPYYGSVEKRLHHRNSGIVFFGSNGRVRDFNWNQGNPMGATIWR